MLISPEGPDFEMPLWRRTRNTERGIAVCGSEATRVDTGYMQEIVSREKIVSNDVVE